MVKVYSTQTCPWCERVKEYLTALNVKFEVADITNDRATAMELLKHTRQMAVPVTQIDDVYIVGFDQEKLNTELKARGLIA
ncbi:MAG: glutaredoxin domain-containing protein [Synergistaceae bacterium]|nr:glutaredoxin domain-containing protein [Synergistaceae bacterium]